LTFVGSRNCLLLRKDAERGEIRVRRQLNGCSALRQRQPLACDWKVATLAWLSIESLTFPLSMQHPRSNPSEHLATLQDTGGADSQRKRAVSIKATGAVREPLAPPGTAWHRPPHDAPGRSAPHELCSTPHQHDDGAWSKFAHDSLTQLLRDKPSAIWRGLQVSSHAPAPCGGGGGRGVDGVGIPEGV